MSLRKELFKGKGGLGGGVENSGDNSLHQTASVQEYEVLEEIDEEKNNLESLPTFFIKPRRKKDYSPVSWETCFDICRDIKIPDSEDVFKAYEILGTSENCPIFVFHHGAAYSGLSFALACSYIKQLMNGGCTMFAYDCRGHGYTKTSDDSNLSLDILSQDLVNVLKAAYGDNVITSRDIFLIGHSIGGCVVADAASKGLIPSMTCLAVLDVVEGSALEAISGMLGFLRTRPTEFKSIENAIEWSVKSSTIRNVESSRITIPSVLKKEESIQTGAIKYVWRTDLAASRPYWEGWFLGLSEKFLSAKAAKFLILAGTDRLDKPLTIAQMQGKYQLLVLPDVGHMVQEDAPDRIANALVEFWKRNERLVLPVKKVTS
ncbi:Alpha/Beta hydrolase protein [Glomus cerebriforme]|uniref:Protein phosphatase methylesterase 1 n=1 Tax=Glomus cerebriforme TaxID=658196 RepID=A0A397TJM1_9GLOM|nr:Alpha/Beta hydrolase protein [Glomus cerebriforme]